MIRDPVPYAVRASHAEFSLVEGVFFGVHAEEKNTRGGGMKRRRASKRGRSREEEEEEEEEEKEERRRPRAVRGEVGGGTVE